MVSIGSQERRRIRLSAAIASEGRDHPIATRLLGGRSVVGLWSGVVVAVAGVLFLVLLGRWAVRHLVHAVAGASSSVLSAHPVVVAGIVVAVVGFVVWRVFRTPSSGVRLSRETRRRYHV